MALVARASKTVRLKNSIIVLMCLVFLAMFTYDGYYNYLQRNDRIVGSLRDSGKANPDDQSALDAWTHWADASPNSRQIMDEIIARHAQRQIEGVDLSSWKSALDIHVQRYIAWGLIVASAASIWWWIRCQQRRAIAEDSFVSPAPGVNIPWEKITLVDNNRWKSIGIVEITYTDANGRPQKAEFDDYKLEREPLLAILEQLAEKAVNAQFIPQPEPSGEAASNAPTQDPANPPSPDQT